MDASPNNKNPYAAKIATWLGDVEPFRHLTRKQMDRFAEATQIVRFPEGERIIRRGDAGDAMFVIVSGHVSIPVRDAEGNTKFEAQLPSGQCFGEMAILTGEPRNADVYAATSCTLLRVPRDIVLATLDDAMAVASHLTEILGDRLLEGGGIQRVGKYQLVRKIGRGGMSLVFEGRHPSLDRPVAVKMLSHQLVHRRNFAERFRNEAKIIASLRHPNILQVFDMEEAYATFFIVMEMLDGEDVSQIVKRGAMEPRDVRRVLVQVAHALDYAHARGIVHRDIKPSNVRIASDGAAKLLDFGLAWVQRYEAELEEDEDIVLGTPYYMSPEQARGDELDHRTDIYSLGVLAYEMLTGQRPFVGSTKSEVQRKHVEAPIPFIKDVRPDVPTDLHEFATHCMQKHPDDRFQNIRQVIDFLSRSGNTSRIRVRSMRLAYDGAVAHRVDAAIERFERAIAKIEGAELREER